MDHTALQAHVESGMLEVNLLERPDLSSCLWNANEIAFSTAIVSAKVFAVCGSKEVHETAGGSGRDYHCAGAGSADGVRLPPYNICNTSMQGGLRVGLPGQGMG